MKTKFFATVSPGIEDIASKEVERLIGCKAIPDIGKIFFEASIENVYILNLKASTLNKIMIQLCREHFDKLDDLYKLAKKIDYGWLIDADQTFAVRSERVGVHNFTSIDISRVVGQAVIDSFLEAYGKRLKVNLDNPEVEVYALVRNNEFILGVNTTGNSLHKRGYRVYEHPAALKPTLASAMLEISGWNSDKGLIDPMCGGGTIPIEAAFKARDMIPNRLREDFAFLRLKIFSRDEYEKIRESLLNSEKREFFEIYGMEKFPRHLNGALKNAEKAGVRETIKFKLGDATLPMDYPEDMLEFIVVNPPYGVRMVPDGRSPKKLYTGFLRALKDKAKGSTLVLITAAYRKFEEAAEENDVAILEEKRVLHGELKAKIFKCKV